MAVATRVIPCLDVAAGRVVKGINFLNLRDMGDPVELAAAYFRQGADEITFLDVTATVDERATTYDVVQRTAEEVFIPLTVGGGIRSIDGSSASEQTRSGSTPPPSLAPGSSTRSPIASARRSSCSHSM